MRDLMKFAAECTAALDGLGIRYAKNIRFSVNTRATSRLGLCRKKGNQYEIEISHLLLDERTPEDSLRDTLFHELLHTCYGCMKHTGRWKAYADETSDEPRLSRTERFPRSCCQRRITLCAARAAEMSMADRSCRR